MAATIAAAEVLKDVDISQLSGSELSVLMRTGRVPSAPGNTVRLDLSARPRKDAVAKAAGGGAPRREKTPPGTPPGPPPSKRSRSPDVAKSAKRPVVAAAEAAGSPEAATGAPRLLMRDLAAFLEGRPAAVQQVGWRPGAIGALSKKQLMGLRNLDKCALAATDEDSSWRTSPSNGEFHWVGPN